METSLDGALRVYHPDFMIWFKQYKENVISPLCGNIYLDSPEIREYFDTIIDSIEKDIKAMEEYYRIDPTL
ncbi:MAG: hypothetical protein PQJ59_16975 [Spirochaetales bacterium]|nr:hypothetical protein [Spirochaetales bacterium]